MKIQILAPNRRTSASTRAYVFYTCPFMVDEDSGATKDDEAEPRK